MQPTRDHNNVRAPPPPPLGVFNIPKNPVNREFMRKSGRLKFKKTETRSI